MSCGDHTSKLCVKLPPFNYANMTEHTQILRKKCTIIQQAKPLNKYLIKLKKHHYQQPSSVLADTHSFIQWPE